MYLLDSNILIYYLDGHKEVGSFVDQIQGKAFISGVSVTELLAKPGLKKDQVELIEAFLEQFSVLDIDEKLAKEAASIKRKYGLSFPDALLAASAKIFDLYLVSKDKVFTKIVELKVIG